MSLYIDGQNGAVSLQLQNYALSLIKEGLVDAVRASSPRVEKEYQEQRLSWIQEASAIAICLPDQLAPNAYKELRALNPTACIIDASASHRLDPNWVYGFPELYSQELLTASNIANPGCFATACIVGAKPLVKAGIISEGSEITFFGSTGYSAGGMRFYMQDKQDLLPIISQAGRPHRHLPEIARYASVNPVLQTLVGSWEHGLLVQFSLPVEAKKVHEAYQQFIKDSKAASITVSLAQLVSSKGAQFSISQCNGTSGIAILVSEDGIGRSSVSVVLDNLGRGSAANLVDCLRIRLSA